MEKLGKAAKNIFIVGIPIVLIAGAIIALYNSNPAKYRSIIQELTGQFPVDAENVLIQQLQSYSGARNIHFVVTSAQHAPSPARHFNPLINKAVDMWCVVVAPPFEIHDIDTGRNLPLRNFLVYQTRPGGRWLVTDGVVSFEARQSDFQDVGCTNYQP
jgi:hypothetical protein